MIDFDTGLFGNLIIVLIGVLIRGLIRLVIGILVRDCLGVWLQILTN